MNQNLKIIDNLIRKYFNYRDQRISLIASENYSSNLMRTSLAIGLIDQYCSRLPEDKNKLGNLSFGHIDLLDDINQCTKNIVTNLFVAGDCDIRLLSGISGLTVSIFSLLEKGDVLLKVADKCGGPLFVKPICQKIGIKTIEMELGENFRLDPDNVYKLYKKHRPKAIFLDSSYILFPHPVKEIRERVGEKALILYDGSQVLGLIAGGQFQDPFAEGANIIHGTLHKTFFGPQKAVLLFRKKDAIAKKIHNTIKDVLVSNTHLHHILALLIATAEMKEFGQAYACQLIANAQYLATKLSAKGLDIVAKEYGYTACHQFWINLGTKKNSYQCFRRLEQVNISTNVIYLPNGNWGLRIGLNELTRLGVKNEELDEISEIIFQVISGQEINKLKYRSLSVKEAIMKHKIKYSFDYTDGKKIIDFILNKIKGKI